MDSRPPRRFTQIKEPWQDDLYGILTPLYEAATGFGAVRQRAAFITAARGHSKTSTLGQFNNWALCRARHHVSITCAAADRDQAHILLERMKKEASHNPWLAKLLTFKNYQVVGPTGVLNVISSDAPSSSGALDDILILDELTWWKKRDLLDILMSGRHKRKDGVLLVISNAGVTDTWQHDLWLAARRSSGWITHEVPPFSAGWLDHAGIEQDRAVLPPSIFKRLHENQWADITEECGFVSRQQVEACVNHEQQTGNRQYKHVLAVDYGAVYDRCAACVCHLDGDDVYLDDLQVWQGSHDQRMQVAELESWLEQRLRSFRVVRLLADPYQLEQVCQRFERHVEVERFNFGGNNHTALAENLRSLIINRRLHLYEDAGPLALPDGRRENLVDELSSLIIEEKGADRWRFNHVEGKHDDRAVALAMASLACVRMKKLANPVAFVAALNEKLEVKDIEDMDYSQVKYVPVFGTHQACPVVGKEEIRLGDYPSKAEAAFAVNVAHELLGSAAPNALSKEKLPDAKRAQQIRDDLVKELTKRKLLPLPKSKKKDEVKEAK